MNTNFTHQFINSKSLFLRNIAEPHENGLRLLLEEASPRSGPTESRLIGGVEITGLRAIESDERSRLFELRWDQYIAYNVTNESYAAADKDSLYEGKLIRVYSKSPFLEFIRKATFATEEYCGPLLHVCVCAENHIVDVVATKLPVVTQMKPDTENVVVQ